MSTEESRRIGLEWAAAMSEERSDDAKAMGAPYAAWFLSGLTSKVSMAGTASYLSRFDSFAEFRKQFSTFDVSIRDVVAEGNKVVLEVETNGTSAAHDRVYKNTGIVKLEVEDGKIKEVREYLDFFALFEFLGVPPQ